ncbi:heterokaryon incompatibility Het-C [Phellopilus nigrolimitatus]|nr:heterokaryon incompatibility Het-C [Phellopilus nigrolimitatus]
MAPAPAQCHWLLALVLLLALLPHGAHAFGAGSIPGYAFLHGRAFRHGDIEAVLAALAKSPHRHAGGGGGLRALLATLFARGLAAVLRGRAAPTFSKADVRRVYFGNWLRDYSQAMDVAGLSKMAPDTLLLVVQALGFMSFGFATREFLITPERLGVYLPVEHIDNPKGYAEKEGDARRVHPALRPPVAPEELEVDRSNGMKKYMATEGRAWDTSTAHVRRTLRACIALGRRVHAARRSLFAAAAANANVDNSKPADNAGDNENEDEDGDDPDDCEEMWEAFRLLGAALHTLEDLLAHSEHRRSEPFFLSSLRILRPTTLTHTLFSSSSSGNWCELALRRLGCADVFCHVGDKVRIRTPRGRAPPLVTGTFGSADFLHSILGEASDHLSQASVVDLTVNMEEVDSGSTLASLRALLARLPAFLNPGAKVAATADLEKRARAHRFGDDDFRRADADTDANGGGGSGAPADLTQYAPSAETRALLWDVLAWRDDIVREVISVIESIPGLAELLEQITDVLNKCVYTLLAPVLIPIVTEVTLALKEESQAVIDTKEQYEVFDNPRASDPTHSILAKDHVDLILNEPAGRVAQVVVEHAVGLVVHAWYKDGDDPNGAIDEILEAFFHPYYATGTSKVQNAMLGAMQQWLDGFDPDDRELVLLGLTKEGVRDGRNKRVASPASSSVDTLSSLDGSTYSYDSASASRPSSSEAHSAAEPEAPLERERERYDEYRKRARGAYAAVLRDPRAPEDARRHAREVLARDRWDERSALPSTSATRGEAPGAPLERTRGEGEGAGVQSPGSERTKGRRESGSADGGAGVPVPGSSANFGDAPDGARPPAYRP